MARAAVLVAALPLLSLVGGCADAAARPDRLTAGAPAADPSASTASTSAVAAPSASTAPTSAVAAPSASTAPTSAVAAPSASTAATSAVAAPSASTAPTSAVAAPSASTAPTSSVADPSASTTPTPGPYDAGLLGAANRLQDLGQADELLGIVSIDSAHNRLVVHRKTGASSPLYPRTVDGFPVVFADALLTHRQTDETMQVLYYDRRTYFAAHHVHVQAVESGGAGPVTVHLDQVSGPAAALVRRVAPYGPRSVAIAGPIVIQVAGGSVATPGGPQR